MQTQIKKFTFSLQCIALGSLGGMINVSKCLQLGPGTGYLKDNFNIKDM